MSYLQDLKSQVDKLESEAQRINKYQALFKLMETPCDMLTDVSRPRAAF